MTDRPTQRRLHAADFSRARQVLLWQVAVAGAPSALADNAKNLPPNVPDWTRNLGDGVGVRPYGHPSKYEKEVIRRTVPWLTATPESSVAFTPLHDA